MSLVEIRKLSAFYGDMQALFDLDLDLAEGECLALVGANGAGKSTIMRSLAGLIADRRGGIDFAGRSIAKAPAEEIARLGIALVPEGRMLFPSLSVEENLSMGALTRRSGPWSMKRAFDLFPILSERRKQLATTLSGGQQQMVAIGRALMANPRLLLCDEISLGLAPAIIGQIYASFKDIRAEGTSLIIVEQDINRAISASDRIACLLKGQITLEAASKAVDLAQLTAAYFGE
jgi:branched-chain amino acid transport system ATP-binding protein